MVEILKVKPVLNKKNGQVNFSLPKKQLSKEMRKMISQKGFPKSKMKIKLEGFE